jgi:predicted metalloprotease
MRGRGMGLPITAGGGVIGLVVLLVVTLLGGGGGGGGGMGDILDQLPGTVQSPDAGQGGQANQEEADFVNFLTEDVQAVWDDIFSQRGDQYTYAQLNLFTGQVNTACGNATSAVGPFYCPADSEVYIDLDFYRELADRFDAPGDFAQAYVIAHEFGHHVQDLEGTSEAVRARQQSAGSQEEANQWSILLELQADCYAGIWAKSVDDRGREQGSDVGLERGDIEEGLAAAEAVGDDRIQEQAGMDVNPETWAHGSSEQRQQWFDRGFDSGDPARCDTFEGRL